jgi:hypothetical protein
VTVIILIIVTVYDVIALRVCVIYKYLSDRAAALCVCVRVDGITVHFCLTHTQLLISQQSFQHYT